MACSAPEVDVAALAITHRALAATRAAHQRFRMLGENVLRELPVGVRATGLVLNEVAVGVLAPLKRAITVLALTKLAHNGLGI